ncbi:hypothetical protein [Mesobacillus jeotgali]|uniref:HhH-GPD domain-containing protein n=1 Tax=Mesobacillus jeotgali TaxID=129985 RepID=A0ABY9VBP2_9BACI|nr:hypothetical protein [Mesobacillus jeotgali]WNF21311.1 hypothetical protein RH061_14015 [Mesobacillus jeotgali]
MEIPFGKSEFFIITLLQWEETNFVDFPWRSTSNMWHALVAEVMLQRTRAEQVVPVYEEFSNKYPTPKSYLDDDFSLIFCKLGLPKRQVELQKLAVIFNEKHIPIDKRELLGLPGVGPYISAAFRSFHLGIPDTIIDSNVVRLYGRYFGFKTHAETRREKWFIQFAEKLTPISDNRKYNYGLIDFTRAICRPAPKCNECPLNKKCDFIKSK